MNNHIVVFAAAAALVLACSNPPKAPVQGVTTTGAGVVSNADAAKRLTQARCDHAKACNELGTGKDYKDEAGCLSEIGHEVEDEYRPAKCPHGVKEERLTSCVNELRNEKCGNLADKISRGEACRRVQLCIE